ncbi:MAG: D-alanyl-D-alanine carboxypeptidase [Clostridia bacterium]|nr:D-alanyl-D-alanine carboxypeptidase [Clostridia bacterium]
MNKILTQITSLILTMVMVISFASIKTSALDDSSITAPSAILYEPSSGKVIYEKNSHEVRACASITKIMTLLLVMEAIDSGKISLDDTVTASAHAASMGGSDIWLEEGEQMSVDDMIKATAVASANDAAVALAEYICGSEESFVDEMNKKAKLLGMKETVFKNCNGLDEEGHVTSAYDVAIMSSELIKHNKIFEYTNIWMDNLRDGKTQIVNTNKLLKTYNGITGLKTGTTSQAGSCITATAERDGLSLVAVVLGSATGAERFTDAAALLDHGFANYECYNPEKPKDLLSELSIKNGMQPTVKIKCDIDKTFICDKGMLDKISYKISYNKDIKAPIKIGDKLGTIKYINGDEVLGEFPILAAENIEKMTFSSVFSLLIKSFLIY